ncbi:CGNR zinc finger domain-containing protein [Streptomyces abikoensis]|uniref:CGNR zinc finger domain-containing protein n=1 Tax=Streptomyces abikoensis TaxID=97398 RepID=UPI0034052516
MTWPATARYGLEAAPGGLGLVQDLLNTAATPAPGSVDLLAALDDARAWADAAIARWTAVTGRPVPPVLLDAEEAGKLRAFRDDLRRLITEGAGDEPGAGARAALPHHGSVTLRLGEDGVVRLEPCGPGRRRLAALALVAVFEAQRDGTWHRLKTCRAPRCRVAFYDRSRNNSGVWHDVKSCGNAANLRASRARRRAREAEDGGV